MEFFEALHVAQDQEHSVILMKRWELVAKENQSKTTGYMLLNQRIQKGKPAEVSTLWFLPNVKGYATACDHAIAARQAIWGDDAP